MWQLTSILFSLLVFYGIVLDDAATLKLCNGVRVEIVCTGTEGGRLTWHINGDAMDPGNEEQFLNDGIKSREDWNGEWFSTLCIEIELKHQNYTLECRIGLDTLYNTTLSVCAQLPPPESISISHASPEVHFELSPPSFDVDSNEDVVINVYPNITHYTVYITNLNTEQEMVYETADNSTEFTLTELPGEDLNECTEYVFEVAANNARAGEGERSEPHHVLIPRGCSNAPSTTPTATPSLVIEDNAIVGPIVGAVVAAILAVTIASIIVLIAIITTMRQMRQRKRKTATYSVKDNEYEEHDPSRPSYGRNVESPPLRSPQTSESTVDSEASDHQEASIQPTTQTITNSHQQEHEHGNSHQQEQEPEQQYANPQHNTSAEQDENPPPVPERAGYYAELAFSGPRAGPTLTEEVEYITVAEHL